MNQGPGQAQSLLHAPGQSVHEEIQLILQPHLLQQGRVSLPCHQAAYVVAGRKEFHVLRHGQVIVHPEEIRHIANHGLKLSQIGTGVHAVYGNPAFLRLQEPCHDFNGSGLSGSVGPHEPVEGAGLHRHVQAA